MNVPVIKIEIDIIKDILELNTDPWLELDPDLLLMAFTLKSFNIKCGKDISYSDIERKYGIYNYQVFEWWGDSIIEFVTSYILFDTLLLKNHKIVKPKDIPGHVIKTRTKDMTRNDIFKLVSNHTLSCYSRNKSLCYFVVPSAKKTKTCADIIESILGVLYYYLWYIKNRPDVMTILAQWYVKIFPIMDTISIVRFRDHVQFSSDSTDRYPNTPPPCQYSQYNTRMIKQREYFNPLVHRYIGHFNRKYHQQPCKRINGDKVKMLYNKARKTGDNPLYFKKKFNKGEIVDETPKKEDEEGEITDEIVDETPEVADEEGEIVDETPEIEDEEDEIVDETPEVADEEDEIVDETPEVADEEGEMVDVEKIPDEEVTDKVKGVMKEEMDDEIKHPVYVYKGPPNKLIPKYKDDFKTIISDKKVSWKYTKKMSKIEVEKTFKMVPDDIIRGNVFDSKSLDSIIDDNLKIKHIDSNTPDIIKNNIIKYISLYFKDPKGIVKDPNLRKIANIIYDLIFNARLSSIIAFPFRKFISHVITNKGFFILNYISMDDRVSNFAIHPKILGAIEMVIATQLINITQFSLPLNSPVRNLSLTTYINPGMKIKGLPSKYATDNRYIEDIDTGYDMNMNIYKKWPLIAKKILEDKYLGPILDPVNSEMIFMIDHGIPLIYYNFMILMFLCRKVQKKYDPYERVLVEMDRDLVDVLSTVTLTYPSGPSMSMEGDRFIYIYGIMSYLDKMMNNKGGKGLEEKTIQLAKEIQCPNIKITTKDRK